METEDISSQVFQVNTANPEEQQITLLESTTVSLGVPDNTNQEITIVPIEQGIFIDRIVFFVKLIF